MIKFMDHNGRVVGKVQLTDGKLVADGPGAQSVIDSWEIRGGTADAFIKFYSRWSNGYVHSRYYSDPTNFQGGRPQAGLAQLGDAPRGN